MTEELSRADAALDIKPDVNPDITAPARIEDELARVYTEDWSPPLRRVHVPRQYAIFAPFLANRGFLITNNVARADLVVVHFKSADQECPLDPAVREEAVLVSHSWLFACLEAERVVRLNDHRVYPHSPSASIIMVEDSDDEAGSPDLFAQSEEEVEVRRAESKGKERAPLLSRSRLPSPAGALDGGALHDGSLDDGALGGGSLDDGASHGGALNGDQEGLDTADYGSSSDNEDITSAVQSNQGRACALDLSRATRLSNSSSTDGPETRSTKRKADSIPSAQVIPGDKAAAVADPSGHIQAIAQQRKRSRSAAPPRSRYGRAISDNAAPLPQLRERSDATDDARTAKWRADREKRRVSFWQASLPYQTEAEVEDPHDLELLERFSLACKDKRSVLAFALDYKCAKARPKSLCGEMLKDYLVVKTKQMREKGHDLPSLDTSKGTKPWKGAVVRLRPILEQRFPHMEVFSAAHGKKSARKEDESDDE